MLCIYLQDRSMCSLQCAERLEAQRQTETWWAAEHLGPVDLPIPAWETEITQAMSFVQFWSTYITCVLPVYICVTLFYPAECMHLCVCVPTCVYTGWAGRREGSWQLPGPRWCGRTVRALRDPWPEPRRAGSAGGLAPPPPRRRCLQGATGD